MQEKWIFRLNFNPGLALTGFRISRPWNIPRSQSTKNSELINCKVM